MLSLTMPSLPAAAVTVVLLVLFIRVLSPRRHPQEPPIVHPKIPYFGHAIGIFRHGARYYSDVA